MIVCSRDKSGQTLGKSQISWKRALLGAFNSRTIYPLHYWSADLKSWLLWLFKSALTLIIWLLLVEIRTIKISWFANSAWFSTVLQIRIRVRIRDGSVSDPSRIKWLGFCTAWPVQKWRDLVRKIRTHASRIRDGSVSDQISGFPYANPGTKIGGTSRQTNPRRIRLGFRFCKTVETRD